MERLGKAAVVKGDWRIYKMQNLAIKVNGMHCTGCEERIARAIGAMDGIVRVAADHTLSEVRVVLDPMRITDAAIRSAIEKLGYEVTL